MMALLVVNSVAVFGVSACIIAALTGMTPLPADSLLAGAAGGAVGALCANPVMLLMMWCEWHKSASDGG